MLIFWQDPDTPSGPNVNKAFLLQMEFASNEVDFAINKLGMHKFLFNKQGFSTVLYYR